MKNFFVALLLLLTSACIDAAQALSPFNEANDLKYVRDCAFARTFVATAPASLATATDGIVLNSPGDTYTGPGDMHLFEFGTSLTFYSPSGLVWVAPVQDKDIIITTGGIVDDPTNVSDGPGAANGLATRHNPTMYLPQGAFKTRVLTRELFQPTGQEGDTSQTGARAGFCWDDATAPTATVGSTDNFGCDAAGDCQGAATCHTNCATGGCGNVNMSVRSGIKGAFIQAISGTGAALTYYIEECR